MTRLDTEWISKELASSTLGRPLAWYESTTSTNDEAKAALPQGAAHGACFVADVQTQGRGRRGRRWEAAPGGALLFSVLLDPPQLADPSPVTLAVGLGVHQALAPQVKETLAIKWPNDLVCGRRKLAGILVETELSSERSRPLVVGVGINVSNRRFPDELGEIATSLSLLGAEVTRERVLVDVLCGIETWYGRLCNDGVSAIVPSLCERDALHGRRIRVDGVPGRALGFDVDGRLLLETADGEVSTVTAGTVEWEA
jgi:BirA family biotin operon repressor/biotin-[acetyl-CoA-carboxylase] ligase